ncbi:glycosyltransferase involved in cell wall biosynthesis [Elusimicrobium posterum]|uniref:glycosyltransferase family 2 protein n=1 Tax=Elusimicrobium posterum TaxID=3116653 RepID=UPI003C76437A
MTDITVIIPVMNEQANIEPLLLALNETVSKTDLKFEYLFVEGGSSDETLSILEEKAGKDERIKIISLSRSFGKEASLLCGFDYAAGRAVIPLDGDMQDPPGVILDFIAKWKEGYHNVYGVRKNRDADGFLKKHISRLFYKIYNFMAERHIPFDAGDYRLLDRKVVEAIKECRERNMFMKGLFGWVGFKSCAVYYDRPGRYAGKTSWNYWKLWNFALDGILNSTTVPLRIWTYFGVLVALISILYALFIVTRTLVFGIDVPGYASLLVFILFFGSIQMISLGILGEYMGRIFKEVKRRPPYIISEKINIK